MAGLMILGALYFAITGWLALFLTMMVETLVTWGTADLWHYTKQNAFLALSGWGGVAIIITVIYNCKERRLG